MIVYLLVNQVNGKCYVGQTRYHSLTRRWSPSLKRAPNAHLAAAIKKYGSHSFRQTVVAHASCQQELDLLEQFFILIYQTTDRRFGYNQQPGGLIGGRHSADTIRRIREGNKRHWETKTPDQRLLYSENARLRWDMWPEERKKRWAEAALARWASRSQEERDRIVELIRRRRQGQKPSVPPWNKGLLGWNAGFHHTPEAKEKVRVANKGRRLGPQSEEHKQHLSGKLRMYWAQKKALPPKKPCTGVKGQGRVESLTNREETRAAVALKEVAQAKRGLREIQQWLDALRFELQGGCNW